jgi:hypothetical protein
VKSKECRLRSFGVLGKGIAVNLKSSLQILSEAASFEGKKDLDCPLVGWVALAALFWVLGDLGA